MSEECTHDCSSCSENCGERQETMDMSAKLCPGASVKKVYAVVSGKGGVGKSLVTSLLASEMQRRGHQAAILDADMTGPSIPKAFGLAQHATGSDQYLYPVTTNSGVQVMSINLILEHDTDPVVWRGPVIAGAVTQFWSEVLWQDVDYMFVDMPPGTGDVPLTVFQSLPVDGIVIVTSPQELVSMIVQKAIDMARQMDIPILGLVENYSYFKCPDNDKEYKIFGESHIDTVAQRHGLKVLARLPIDPALATACDTGTIEGVGEHFMDGALAVIANM